MIQPKPCVERLRILTMAHEGDYSVVAPGVLDGDGADNTPTHLDSPHTCREIAVR